MRSRSPLLLAVLLHLVLLTPVVWAQPVEAPAAASTPDLDEIDRAVEKVRADPNLPGTRYIRTLKWQTPRGRWSWPDWLSWIGDLLKFIAQSGRALAWTAMIVLALMLIAYLVRIVSAHNDGASGGRFITPTHVRDLDIRPESLPPDIGAAARRLWDQGDHRAALALLYRGLLSRLAHVHEVPIRDSTTEGDCVSLAVQHLEAGRHDYVARLVQVWQRAVYGGIEADPDIVYDLCDAFSGVLDAGDARAAAAAGATA